MNAQRRKKIRDILAEIDGVAEELAEAEPNEVAELVRDVELLADKLAGLADDERDAADAVHESFEEQRETMEGLADIISDTAESLHDATAEEKPYKMAAAIRDIIGDLETTDGIA